MISSFIVHILTASPAQNGFLYVSAIAGMSSSLPLKQVQPSEIRILPLRIISFLVAYSVVK
jgi:hypothetical protein